MRKDRGEEDAQSPADLADIRNDLPVLARDLYRRGAMAVARSGGDGGTLMLLAGGAALAGVSWLMVRRRARRDRA